MTDAKTDDLKVISEKLEVINLQLARAREAKQKRLHLCFITLFALTVIVAIILYVSKSPYLNWDYSDPEIAVVGTALHAFEFIFIRIAPFVLTGTAAGIALTRKKG